MKHLLFSTLLAFSVSTSFAADAEKTKAMPKCTADHVPITIKTKDGKSYTAFVKPQHVKMLTGTRALEAQSMTCWEQDRHRMCDFT